MARQLVSDELWARVEPLIPKHAAPSEKGGRPPLDDRAALTGSVCLEDRHSVGGSSVGNELRMRHDLLATPARLATSRGLGSAAPGVPGRVERRPKNRLVESGRRQ